MSHFPDESWFDYVRDLLPSDQTKEMKSHLEDGCKECRDSYDIWHRILTTVGRESQYGPDPSDVRVVKAAFQSHLTSTSPSTGILATLVFDSLHHPAPAGFRTALAHPRHLLYEGDNWTVALRLSIQQGNEVSLIGHVAESGPRGTARRNLEVTVSRRGVPIAHSIASDVGEFYVTYENLSDIRLSIRISNADILEVELPRPELRA